MGHDHKSLQRYIREQRECLEWRPTVIMVVYRDTRDGRQVLAVSSDQQPAFFPQEGVEPNEDINCFWAVARGLKEELCRPDVGFNWMGGKIHAFDYVPFRPGYGPKGGFVKGKLYIACSVHYLGPDPLLDGGPAFQPSVDERGVSRGNIIACQWLPCTNALACMGGVRPEKLNLYREVLVGIGSTK